jgi:hypothetical protein
MMGWTPPDLFSACQRIPAFQVSAASTATPADGDGGRAGRFRPVKVVHKSRSDAIVASGHLQLAAPSVTLRRNVDFLQHGPTILPTRHSGASWKIAMAVVGVVWLGSVTLWMLKEFDNVD